MSPNPQGNEIPKQVADAREQVMLRRLPGAFLSEIPQQFIALIEEIAQARTFAPGACLFSEGASPTEFQIVQKGHVRLEMTVPGRGKVGLLTVGPGEILAWSALLSDAKLTATGTAMEPVHVLAIPGTALKQLCERHSELGYHVMKQLAVALSRRLLATRIQLLDLFSAHEPAAPLSLSLTPVDPEC